MYYGLEIENMYFCLFIFSTFRYKLKFSDQYEGWKAHRLAPTPAPAPAQRSHPWRPLTFPTLGLRP